MGVPGCADGSAIKDLSTNGVPYCVRPVLGLKFCGPIVGPDNQYSNCCKQLEVQTRNMQLFCKRSADRIGSADEAI